MQQDLTLVELKDQLETYKKRRDQSMADLQQLTGAIYVLNELLLKMKQKEQGECDGKIDRESTEKITQV